MNNLRQFERLEALRKMRTEIAETALVRQARLRDEAERQMAIACRRAAEHEAACFEREAAWLDSIAKSPVDPGALEIMASTIASMSQEAGQLRASVSKAQQSFDDHVEEYANKSEHLRLRQRDCDRLQLFADRQKQRDLRRVEARIEQDEEEIAARRSGSIGIIL